VNGELPSASGELAAGSQIAGYQIEAQIGRGGMAVVYRAFDARLGRSVALKILAPELALDEAFRQRFLREMRAAASIDHPHIIPVFDAGEADGALFIAMRYVSGQDVRRLLDREHTLPAERSAHIIAQVASALDEAHSRGMVHRDVKPGNILIATVAGSGQPDHVYLSDFGLSKQSVSASITSTGQFVGTLDYMAPEQIEGRPIDGRADLYGLACTAYEMLSGVPPFQREQSIAVMWAQLSSPPPSLTQLRPELPPAVDQVMARAMAKSPDDRYQTCGAFAEALQAAGRVGPGEEAGGARSAGKAVAPGPPTEMAQIRQPDQPTSWPASPVTPAGPVAAASLADQAEVTDPQPWPATSWSAAPQPAAQPPFAPPPVTSWPDPPPATSWPDPPPRGGPGRYTAVDGGTPNRYTAGGYSAGSYPPRKAGGRRSRGPAAAIAGCVVLLAIVGIAVFVLRGHGASSPPGNTTNPTSPASSTGPANSGPGGGPAATVQAYVRAINHHEYLRAWSLGGKNTGSSYQTFVHGFAGTARDNLTIVSVTGDVVNVRLAAVQTNGSVKDYKGTYTVQNGVITQSQIQPDD
jgi:serine/threonine protein kinase